PGCGGAARGSEPGVLRGAGLVVGSAGSPALADALQLLLERRSVRVEHPLRDLAAAADRDRPQGPERQRRDARDDAFLLARFGAIVEVAGKLPLERSADRFAVRPELPQRLLDLLRQELRRQLLLLARHGPLRAAEEPLRATEREERASGRDPGGLRRVLADLGRDVDGRPPGGLEPIDLVVEVGPGRYDLRVSGVRSRAHSIVSFVTSMVRSGVKRCLSSSVSTPWRAMSVPIRPTQTIRPTATPIAAPTRGPVAIAVRTPMRAPPIAPPTRPPIPAPTPARAAPPIRPRTPPTTARDAAATTRGR